jgi:CDP-paratose 2-epimerase
VIFHLAGQVAMTTSIANPMYDFEVNAVGSLNVLESVRQHLPETMIIYSSTNKVYGDLEWVEYEEKDFRYIAKGFVEGFAENTPLDFRSPYGCSKGAADQYMLDYARIFGLKTVVFRHSSMYGGRQFSSYDQGWVGWFCQQAIFQKEGKLQESFTISGNGKQVRDVLHADDIRRLYFLTIEHIDIARGEVFNVGGGRESSLSLLELLALLEKEMEIKLLYNRIEPRKSDQKVFVADIHKASSLLSWRPLVSAEGGVKSVLLWLSNHENRANYE